MLAADILLHDAGSEKFRGINQPQHPEITMVKIQPNGIKLYIIVKISKDSMLNLQFVVGKMTTQQQHHHILEDKALRKQNQV
jgi:hypothetical protein